MKKSRRHRAASPCLCRADACGLSRHPSLLPVVAGCKESREKSEFKRATSFHKTGIERRACTHAHTHEHTHTHMRGSQHAPPSRNDTHKRTQHKRGARWSRYARLNNGRSTNPHAHTTTHADSHIWAHTRGSTYMVRGGLDTRASVRRSPGTQDVRAENARTHTTTTHVDSTHGRTLRQTQGSPYVVRGGLDTRVPVLPLPRTPKTHAHRRTHTHTHNTCARYLEYAYTRTVTSKPIHGERGSRYARLCTDASQTPKVRAYQRTHKHTHNNVCARSRTGTHKQYINICARSHTGTHKDTQKEAHTWCEGVSIRAPLYCRFPDTQSAPVR